MAKKQSTQKEMGGSPPRPPVIVVMGHIDHGKSTLLDTIRKSDVVAGEAGGITQKTYAYEIVHTDQSQNKKRITFIDTPGHAAFSLMRESGARVADIAILVVAADDGVKPQTLEALKVIKESEIPFIVAINKIDKEGTSPDKTKQELAEHGVFVEGYGGDVPVVALSAKTGGGIPELLDMLLLLAEMAELKADPAAEARGAIVEAHREPQRGISATVVTKDGTLKAGMYIVVEGAVAPVRRIENFLGEHIEIAPPGTPAMITGFAKLPPMGALYKAFPDKRSAAAHAQNSGQKAPSQNVETRPAQKVADREDDSPPSANVPIVLKADSLGSLDAVIREIGKLSIERIVPRVIYKDVGPVSETDVKFAPAGDNPIIIGFNVKIETPAKEYAERYRIESASFDIIYELVEWLGEKLAERRPKMRIEEKTGSAKIVRIFNKTKQKQVVGGKVTDGKLSTPSIVKIVRREHEIDRGKIIELRQNKAKVREVAQGLEFGAMIEARHDIAPGDLVEAFVIREQ